MIARAKHERVIPAGDFGPISCATVFITLYSLLQHACQQVVSDCIAPGGRQPNVSGPSGLRVYAGSRGGLSWISAVSPKRGEKRNGEKSTGEMGKKSGRDTIDDFRFRIWL